MLPGYRGILHFRAGFFIYPLILLLSISVTLRAQVADSVVLEPIEIRASRLSVEDAYQPYRIQKIKVSIQDQSQSAAELIARRSPFFVKNQGAGLLASPASRGFSPEQTLITWNGFKLNHPMVGQLDLSLLPMYALSQVEMQSGGASSESGGGSVGNHISLQQRQLSKSFTQLSVGSFETQKGAAGFSHNQFSAIVYAEQAENNFTYLNNILQREEIRRNNAQFGLGALVTASDENADFPWKSNFWWQRKEREIPGTIGGITPKSDQYDEQFLFTNTVKLKQGSLPWQINAGAGLYKLDYLRPDPAQGGEIVASKSDSYQIQINSTNRLFYNEKAWIESEQFVHYTGVSTNNYRDFKERWETGISFRSVLIPFENLRLFPRIRLDFISSYGAVISPAFGFNYSILSDLNLFGETSYNFNPPTFNSLYWPGMGDEDLDAERSLKSELGFRGEQELAKQFQVNLSLTGYLAFVNDGIMWIPDAETGLYRPQNVIESTHKGGESDVALNMTVGKTTLSAFSAIGYTRAEMTKSRFENDRALNKQFRYVPEWTFKHGITAKYKNVTLSLYHQQVSERYTKEDNSASLPSYSSFEGEISFTYTLFDTQFQHRLEIDNLTDESYQIIAGYPVPGRSFLFTTTLTFK